MDIKLPVDIKQNSAASAAEPVPFVLQLNQRLDARIVDSQIKLNALVLQVDDKTLLVESKPQLTLPKGQSLQLQVVKLLPSPEFKVLSPELPQTDTQAAESPTLKLLGPQTQPAITPNKSPLETNHPPPATLSLGSVIDFPDAETEQRLILQLRLLLQRIQGSASSLPDNTLTTQKNETAMNINLSPDASLQLATAKPMANALNLKLDQLIGAKVVDTQLMLNTLTLNMADKTVVVQGKPPFPIQSGQTLQLQVVKLLPAPEFRIVTTATPQTNNPGITDSQTLKLLNILPQSSTNSSAKIALNQLAAGQQFQATVLNIVANKVTLQLLAANLPLTDSNPASLLKSGQPTVMTNQANILITLDAKQLMASASKTSLPTSPLAVTPDLKALNPGKAQIPALPILTIGTQINLQVIKPGNAPTFAVSLPATDTEQKLVELFKQLLPIQASPAPLLNHLAQILPALENDASVAETLKKLAQDILLSIPLKTQLTEPSQLKQTVDQSGLFLESKLAELLFGKAGISLQDDMKLKLMNLVQQLTAEIEAQTLTNTTDLLKETLQKTQGALAKLTLEQFNSIPKDESPKQVWMLELPFVHDHKTDSVQIEIEQDKSAKQDGTQKNWAVSITITPPELATIHCKISCYDGAVNTRFWSDAATTVDKINTHLDYLKQRFEQQGLITGFMEAHQGKPAQTASTNKQMTNLLSEKV